jgi:hypothetical protein
MRSEDRLRDRLRDRLQDRLRDRLWFPTGLPLWGGFACSGAVFGWLLVLREVYVCG